MTNKELIEEYVRKVKNPNDPTNKVSKRLSMALSYSGLDLYSYVTKIATAGINGCIIINPRKYSKTTNRHTNLLKAAANQINITTYYDENI